MKTSYILLLALLGVSALSTASATFGRSDSRPTVTIRTNATGIVTLSAVNTALNQTWRTIQRTWGRTNKTITRPSTPAPLAAFLDADALLPFLAKVKGVNVTLLSADAFQVTRTRFSVYNPVVQYLASTTNGTNVTGLVFVMVPKAVWAKPFAEDAEDVETSNFFNITKPTWNFTRPTPQPIPFRSMVTKRIARNESTTTITVADINGVASGNNSFVKAATLFGARPSLATITSAAASKWSWATVGFNATVSNTSFTVTVSNRAPVTWITVAVTGVSTTNTTSQGVVSVKITRSRK